SGLLSPATKPVDPKSPKYVKEDGSEMPNPCKISAGKELDCTWEFLLTEATQTPAGGAPKPIKIEVINAEEAGDNVIGSIGMETLEFQPSQGRAEKIAAITNEIITQKPKTVQARAPFVDQISEALGFAPPSKSAEVTKPGTVPNELNNAFDFLVQTIKENNSS